MSQIPAERRVRLDPSRLAHGGSSLACYLDIWRESRAGEAMSFLGRLQARGLDRHVMVIDLDDQKRFTYRFLGSGLSFASAAARARLIGKPQEAFVDVATVRAARDGYLAAIESDRPLCEMVDRPRLDADGRPLPRIPFRRLVLPLPINRRITRAVIASEFVMAQA